MLAEVAEVRILHRQNHLCDLLHRGWDSALAFSKGHLSVSELVFSAFGTGHLLGLMLAVGLVLASDAVLLKAEFV